MMSKDLGGVVDGSLLVYGTANVRVCDASVIPILPRGNILSTVYALTEKGGGYFERRCFLAKEKGLGLRHVTFTPHPPHSPALLSSYKQNSPHFSSLSFPQKFPILKHQSRINTHVLTPLQSHPQTSSRKSFVAHRTANDFPVEQRFG
jgi:hypothetical protein